MGYAFRKLKRYEDSIYHLQISLTYNPPNDKLIKINQSLMISFQKLDRKDDALIHAKIILELTNELESFSEKKYKIFNRVLRFADEIMFQKTKNILDDLNRSCIQLEDNAFVNWNELLRFQKVWVEKNHSYVKKNLQDYANKMRFILLVVNEILTGETIGIIHLFLYTV